MEDGGANTLNNLAQVLSRTDRSEEAQELLLEAMDRQPKCHEQHEADAESDRKAAHHRARSVPVQQAFLLLPAVGDDPPLVGVVEIPKLLAEGRRPDARLGAAAAGAVDEGQGEKGGEEDRIRCPMGGLLCRAPESTAWNRGMTPDFPLTPQGSRCEAEGSIQPPEDPHG